MALARVYEPQYLKNPATGNLQLAVGASVQVNQPNSNTLFVGNIWGSASGGTLLSNPLPILGASGIVEFWLDSQQDVDLVVSLAGYSTDQYTVSAIDTADTPSNAALTSGLAGKSAVGHTHVEGDVGSLSTDLAGKAPTVHTHAAGDITSGTIAVTRLPVLTIAAGMHNATGFTTGVYFLPRIPASRVGTALKIQARAAGGTSLAFNIRKNGTLNLLAADLTVTSGGTFAVSTTLQNAALATDDYLDLLLNTVTGTVTDLEVQVETQ